MLVAWEQQKSEIAESASREILKLESEILRIKDETDFLNAKINALEEENEDLEEKLSQSVSRNEKLKEFKENLKKSLISDAPKPNSPTYMYGAQIDKTSNGKSFFKEVRTRLSYEAFSMFLGYVKKLNDKVIKKESALQELQEIFGEDNIDLYEKFASLLLRKNI